MPLLRTTTLVQLLLNIDTSWHLSPILYSLAHFLAHPTLYTPHSFTSIRCNLRPQVLKQSTSSNCSPFSLTCIRPPFPYLEHLIILLLPTFTLIFLLGHTLPNSLISLYNFTVESATSAVSSANNMVYLEPATIYTQQFQPFSKHPCFHLVHHIIHIFIKQLWRHHTTLSQSNSDRKSLTHIHSYPDTPNYLHRNFAPLSTIFLQLHTLFSICHMSCRSILS